ncbi:unnamed protein product [Ostreobium quekettii]|uniref:PsbP C-terminal domain-containing protein n=1 Tax=Ostreobium quekettii TaxID=121088 RepID=A0A8S1JAM4_9CHLO|nr:unnamed protein product [Ostreobium quekettii]
MTNFQYQCCFCRLWPGVAASTCSEAIDGTSTTCSPLLNTELREVTTSQYSLSVPADYLGFDGIEATATGTLGVAVSTPPLLRYGSADGKENLSVVVRDAASIKPTFFQITDITQYGGLADVAKLVLPKNSRFLSAESITLPQPPYDTGTIRGVIELPDIHLYRYEFQTVEDQHYALSIAASRGQVYFVGASAPVDRWNDEKETLLNSVQSFRLKRY